MIFFRSPGTQSPGIFARTSPPHERLQLGLDVRVEERLLVVYMQSSQDGLLLLWHAFYDQRTLDQVTICGLIFYLGPVDVAAIVLPTTRQIC